MTYINIKPGERNYHTQINNALYSSYNSVEEGLDVTDINGMSITLSSGKIYYKGNKFDIASSTVTLSNGHPDYTRIDLIAYNGTNIVVLEGTASGDPKPVVYEPSDYVILYQVHVLPSATQLSQDDIKDLRVPARPWVTQDQIDTVSDNLSVVESNLNAHTSDLNNPHQTNITNLTDTQISNLVEGQGLVYNGSEWVNDYLKLKTEIVQTDTTLEKNRLYIVKPSGNVWDLSSVNYDNVSLTTSNAYNIFFKPDGTSLYFVNHANNRVEQYTLKTPWDLSTAVYDNVSFKLDSVGELEISGISFSLDGKKMFILGVQTSTVYQCTLTNPWDLSTASYNGASFSVSGQETAPRGLFFKPDGTAMYIVGEINKAVYQYSLSTPWELSTASYDNKSVYLGYLDVGPRGIFLSPDGKKLFFVGIDNIGVYELDLSTPWDISTAVYNGVGFSVSSETSNPYGLFFDSEGKKLYITSSSGNIFQYSLIIIPNLTLPTGIVSGDAFHIIVTVSGVKVYCNIGQTLHYLDNSLSPTSDYIEIEQEYGYIVLVAINETDLVVTTYNDTKLVPWDSGWISTTPVDTQFLEPDKNYLIKVGEPWELRVVKEVYSYDTSSIANDIQSIYIRSDGLKAYIINSDNNIYQFSLSTPWDLSSMTYDNISFFWNEDFGLTTDIEFKDDGTKMFVMALSRIYQYTLSTPWDISTATYDNVVVDFSGVDNSFKYFTFGDNGKKLYLSGFTPLESYTVKQYDLSTPWDITTGTFTNSIGVASNNKNIFISPDGSYMYISTGSVVYKYELTIPFEIKSANYDNSINLTSTGLYFKPDGVYMYLAQNDKIIEYFLENNEVYLPASTNKGDEVQIITEGKGLKLRLSSGQIVYNTDSKVSGPDDYIELSAKYSYVKVIYIDKGIGSVVSSNSLEFKSGESSIGTDFLVYNDSGDVSRTITDYSSGLVVNECSSTDNWSGTSVSLDTSDYWSGTSAVKDSVSSPTISTEYSLVYTPTESLNLSKKDYLYIVYKNSRDSSAYNKAVIRLKTDSSNYFEWNLSFTANVWNIDVIDLKTPDNTTGAPDLSDITSVEFLVEANDTTGFSTWIDLVLGLKSDIETRYTYSTNMKIAEEFRLGKKVSTTKYYYNNLGTIYKIEKV